MVGVLVPFMATLVVGMSVAGATKVAFGSAVWQLPEIFEHWHPVLSVLGAPGAVPRDPGRKHLGQPPLAHQRHHEPGTEALHLPRLWLLRPPPVFRRLPLVDLLWRGLLCAQLSRRLRHGHGCHRWRFALRLLDPQLTVSGFLLRTLSYPNNMFSRSW